MKDKLIQKIKDYIQEMKEDNEIVLEYTDENKKEIIENLFIPFIDTFDVEDIDELKNKINYLIEQSSDEDYDKFIDEIADSILTDLSDEEQLEIIDNIDNFVTNIVAIYNKFKDEEAISNITKDIENFVKELDNDKDSEQKTNTEEKNNEKDIEDQTTESGNEEDKTDEPNNEDKDETPNDNKDNKDEASEANVKFTIVNPSDEVDETPQSDVNKVELKNKLMDAYEAAEDKEAIKAVIDEVFALVDSYEKTGDWKWPHHSIKGEKVLLNVNGLKTAAMFLLKPNSSKNLSPEQKATIAKHLLKHYKEIEEEAPEKLSNIAENKESVVMINIKDDEYKEFAETFGINEESIYVYIGLIESLLTDLINSGIIKTETDEDNKDESSVVTIKLSKEQTDEFLKYFDIITNDIVNILDNKLESLSYKSIKSAINDESVQETISENEQLKSTIEDLQIEIANYKKIIADKEEKIEKQNLVNDKFIAIMEFIKTIEDVDETLVQFINNVVECNDESEIKYLMKIGKTFMKSSKSTPKFRKTSNITGLNVDKIFNLLEDNTKTKDESGLERINKKVETLASMFD